MAVEPPTIPTTPDSGTTMMVDVIGNVTVRFYVDGSVQRNAWENEAEAQAYAQSVATQEGFQ